MQLTPIQFVTGLFSLLLALISIYVGLYIASRYRKYNNKILLYVGLGWIGLMNGWWPSAINFVLVVATGTAMSEVPFFIIGNVFIPFFLFIWMIGVTELLYKEKQKYILIFFLIFAVIFDGLIFYYLTTDPSKMGQLQGPVDVKYTGLYALFLITLLIIVAISGVLFARESLKSEQNESKLRGIFILYAFLSWVIGSILDASVDLNFATLPIIRIILITSNLASYIGFIIPKFIKKIFLKQE